MFGRKGIGGSFLGESGSIILARLEKEVAALRGIVKKGKVTSKANG